MGKTLFQVSTLQALMLGYTRKVITVEELLTHGNTGLGTFEDVGGEMILLDGHCYQAKEDGQISEAPPERGVPFAVAAVSRGKRRFPLADVPDIEALKTLLDLKIEEDFGLNSIHIARIDGVFEKILARSESAFRSQHIELKEILKDRQRDYALEAVTGSIVAIYFPDYMDGINAPGWHFHFITEDRTRGGHVFGLVLQSGTAVLDKLSRIDIQLPTEAAFDTYSLKNASQQDIKAVEQG